jgi:putative transposase
MTFLKEVEIAYSLSQKRAMIEANHPQLSMSKQCDLLSIHRSGLYHQPVEESEPNLLLMRKLDEQHLLTPYYGIRKMTAWLLREGFLVNPKRVARLRRLMGLQTIYPKRNLSKPNAEAKKYPYLLKGLAINEVHQADYRHYVYADEERLYVFGRHY